MFEQEERRLYQVKERLDLLEVPERIDLYVRQGIAAARTARNRRAKIWMAGVAVCCMLFAMFVSIRFSPKVAAYVSQIPGMDAVVDWIHYDKGMKLAIDHGLVQPLNLSVEQSDIAMTVDKMIMDDSRMILFYTLDVKGELNRNEIAFKTVGLYDTHGNLLTDRWSASADAEGHSVLNFTFSGQKIEIPDRVVLKPQFGIRQGDEQSGYSLQPVNGVWSITIPVDKTKFAGMKEEYELNETIEVQGQKIKFGKLTLYPTRVELEVAQDPGNTKQIFGYDDLRLVDDQGEEFSTVKNGVTATTVNDQYVLFMESNYFKHPQGLYLQGGSMTALDKDKLEVKIDLDQEAILQKPDDRLQLTGIRRGEKQITVTFELRNDDPLDEHFTYGVFSSNFTDASGKSYFIPRSGMWKVDSVNNITLELPNEPYEGPLTLIIDQYPTRIKAPFKIKVK